MFVLLSDRVKLLNCHMSLIFVPPVTEWCVSMGNTISPVWRGDDADSQLLPLSQHIPFQWRTTPQHVCVHRCACACVCEGGEI
jgi:hypothetical protein